MTKQSGLKRLVMTMSILLIGVTSMPAETDEPGPFERLFHAMRRAFNEPQHRSTHRRSHKQTDETTKPHSDKSNPQTTTGAVNAPPNEPTTPYARRVTGNQKAGLDYSTPA